MSGIPIRRPRPSPHRWRTSGDDENARRSVVAVNAATTGAVRLLGTRPGTHRRDPPDPAQS